jgi:hypothetical protein
VSKTALISSGPSVTVVVVLQSRAGRDLNQCELSSFWSAGQRRDSFARVTHQYSNYAVQINFCTCQMGVSQVQNRPRLYRSLVP